MKRVYASLASVLLLAVLFFTGCKKTSSNNLLTGNLFGFVTLNDQYGARVTEGLNTATITLTAMSNNQTWTAYTDTTGKYTINNLTEGQYLISFSAPGYGGITNTTLSFLGGGNIDKDEKLSATPNFYDSILNPPVDTLNGIYLYGTFSGSSLFKREYIVYVGATPQVSSAPANYLTEYTGTANANLTTFTRSIALSDLGDLGFTSGQTVYFAVYGAATNVTSSSDVEDYTTGKEIYTAISSQAATASIVMP